MTNRPPPIRLFLSYAHEDRAWCVQLLEHLGWLVNSEQLHAFDDSQIGAGEEWDQVIKAELESADIILLIVTVHFMASKYATTVELHRALQRHGTSSSRIIPIIADHCDWTAMPISRRQSVPLDSALNLKPLVDWPNPNVPLAAIAQSIRLVVEKLQARSAEPAQGKEDEAQPPTKWFHATPVKAVAAVAALFILAAIWWNASAVSQLLGRRPAGDVATIPPVPSIARVSPEAGKVQIFVSRFLGDNDNEFQKLVASALGELDGVRLRTLAEVVVKESPDQTGMVESGHARAAQILSESGADGVLWGVLLKSGTTQTLQLYWKGKGERDRRTLGRYKPDDTLQFPTLWSDVRRQIENGDSALSVQDRSSVAAQLVPFVDDLLSPEGAAPPTQAGARGVRVHFIDVGSGDAMWIQGPVQPNGTRTNVLVDGGPDLAAANRVPAYLRSNGMTEGGVIDEMIVTHFHNDHYNGFIEVLNQFEVRRIVIPHEPTGGVSAQRFMEQARRETADGHAATLIVLDRDKSQRPEWGDALSVRILSADNWFGLGGRSPANENNASIVLRMKYGNTSFLLMADAESEIEEELLQRESPSNLRSDVLKVGWHGSRNASTGPFLDAVHPGLLVVSSGRKAFGTRVLPDPPLIDRLMALPWKPTVLRTDLDDAAEGRDVRSDQDHDDIFVDSDGVRLFAYQARATPGGRRWVPVKTTS